LFFDRPSMAIPPRGLADGDNFRITNGFLNNLNMGGVAFGNFQLDGPSMLIERFFDSTGANILVMATGEDIYQYEAGGGTVAYLTPRYETGTVDVTLGSPTVVGNGSSWSDNAKAGDMIFIGGTGETDPTETWYEVDTVVGDEEITLTTNYAGADAAGTTYTLRQRFAGDLLHPWDTATFLNAQPAGEDRWYATNGVDYVVRWNGSDDQVTVLSALAFKCTQVLTFANMLIYANIVEDTGEAKPTSIKNSDVTKPEELADGLASEFVVHGGTDEIETLFPLADNMVIYSGSTVVTAQFVGDPYVFAFRTAITGLGPLASRLVADFGDYHEFLAADSKYKFDGLSVEESGAHAWRDIMRRRDSTRVDMGFVHFDEENGELLWVLPLTTDTDAGLGTQNPPGRAWVEHYLENLGANTPHPVSTREFPFTCSGYSERTGTLTWDTIESAWEETNIRWDDQFYFGAFPFNLAGDNDGLVYNLNTAQTAPWADGKSFVRFGRLPLGDGRMRGLLRRVYVFGLNLAEKVLGVTVRLADSAEGAVEETETFTLDLDLPENGYFVSPFRRGRYMELEFGTSGLDKAWGMSGWDIDLTAGGRR